MDADPPSSDFGAASERRWNPPSLRYGAARRTAFRGRFQSAISVSFGAVLAWIAFAEKLTVMFSMEVIQNKGNAIGIFRKSGQKREDFLGVKCRRKFFNR
jgi:hypothetical protein